MENMVRKDTVGKVEEIEAKYQLLQRGQYTVNVPPADLKAIALDKNTPLDLYQARNAIRIARWAGADTSATESFQNATKLLDQAEAYKTRKAGNKSIAMTARQAVQTAEDARLITLKNQADDRLAKERAASANREESANVAAANARADANDSERAKAAALALAAQTKADADRAAQRAADDARALAERTRLDAESAAQRTERDKAAAEAANLQAKAAAVAQAEREKQELRAKLVGQLNSILQTKDTARGLIVNMSDVLFDSGQFFLKPGAREKLAKISGIVLAYPTLALQIEGHTDNVGSDELNNRLSENRANAVRDFLMGEGVAGTSVGAHGLGETQPVATNDTATGRQQNRRVELIVSGDVIGTSISGSVDARPQQ
jgi:outer membrane protein OmpA-like peptidoglycan-associated protein